MGEVILFLGQVVGEAISEVKGKGDRKSMAHCISRGRVYYSSVLSREMKSIEYICISLSIDLSISVSTFIYIHIHIHAYISMREKMNL